MEISYFQNQQLFRLEFEENDEHYELICKIKLLNLIKLKLPPDNRSNITTNPIASRIGLQFSWIQANLLRFFLADVRNSRGKFDEIKEKFVINPAPIASQSSLNVGGSR